MKNISIAVSDEVRGMFDKHAVQFCKDAGLPVEQFNQDANAWATMRSMREIIGFNDWPADGEISVKLDKVKFLMLRQLAKVAGNASANRQRLNSERKAPMTVVAANVKELVGLA